MASLGETFYAYGVFRTRFYDDYLTAAAAGCSHGAAARCSRATVPADLRGDWTTGLTEAGFDRTSPAAWLAEGVLVYLSAAEAGQLLTSITTLSAPGSQLSLEHSPAATATLTGQASQMPAMRQYARLWKGGLGDDAPRWLDSHGWQPKLHDLTAIRISP